MNDSDEHLLNFPQENLGSRVHSSLSQNACRWSFLSGKHLETVLVPRFCCQSGFGRKAGMQMSTHG